MMELDSLLLKTLKKYWGYSSFKEGQLNVCKAIIADRKDAFVCMATGTGKSLMFQLPVVAMRQHDHRYITLVISPLLSLIEDQVSALLQMSIPACSLCNRELEAMVLEGQFAIVYTTPEKLALWAHNLKILHQRFRILCVAIDESHCVSEWGHDFRKEYRQLGIVRSLLGPSVPILALTASATPIVQQDIITNLNLSQPVIIKAGLNRSNLKYIVLQRSTIPDIIDIIVRNRRKQLERFPEEVDQSEVKYPTTLIYVNSRKLCEKVASEIVSCSLLPSIHVAYYHADMDNLSRQKVHHAFLRDDIDLIVSTTAFGMGINKPDVRLVIHFGLALSLEGYYQQTGRAGRDGHPSQCYLLWSRNDINHVSQLLLNNNPHPERGQQCIETMLNYAKGGLKCRRKFILHHFGEVDTANQLMVHEDCCDLCQESCRHLYLQDGDDGFEVGKITATEKPCFDVSKEVYMLLSMILDCGGNYGLTTPISLLLGHNNKSVQRVYNYQNLPFYGHGKGYSMDWWKTLAADLADGAIKLLEIRLVPGNRFYQLYTVSDRGRSFLNGYGLHNHDANSTYGSARQPYSIALHSVDGLEFSSEFLKEHQRHLRFRSGRNGLSQHQPTKIQRLSTVPMSSLFSSSRHVQPPELQINSEHSDMMQFDAHGQPINLPHASYYQEADETEEDRLQQRRRDKFLERTRLESSIRSIRNEIAERRKVPPYSVITTNEIAALIEARPTSSETIMQLLHWATWKESFAEEFIMAMNTALPLALSTSSSSLAGQQQQQQQQPMNEIDEEAAMIAAAEEAEKKWLWQQQQSQLRLQQLGGQQQYSVNKMPPPPKKKVIAIYKPNYDANEEPVEATTAENRVPRVKNEYETLSIPHQSQVIESGIAQKVAAQSSNFDWMDFVCDTSSGRPRVSKPVVKAENDGNVENEEMSLIPTSSGASARKALQRKQSIMGMMSLGKRKTL